MLRQTLLATRRIVTSPILKGPIELPKLEYGYKDLEPVINSEIMELHHSKHHQTYVTNYNAALEKLKTAVANQDHSAVVQLGPALKFNGGGHINHDLFWKTLSKNGGKPSDALLNAIKASFGSLDKMKDDLTAASVGIQGSGWGWLGYDPKSKHLKIATTANQDPLLETTGLIPLFGIDVWEHAYYLQYKNVRPNYVKAIYDVMNWNYINKLYEQAKSS
uniref:Superoxide dismutase n=2 Tax=Cacopsylla melanoneura TaxID=428564 RepID=A0A8D8R3C5_9HEMI